MTEILETKTAVFVGTARNCEGLIQESLDRWAEIQSLFFKSYFLVAENDSSDGTKIILSEWAKSGPDRSLICLDGLRNEHARRTVVLAQVRNRLLDEIRAQDCLRRADYLIVMDLDGVSRAITPARVAACMSFKGWDALFANQLFFYRDVWALRDDRRSRDDFRQHLAGLPHGPRRRLARLRHLTWRNRPIWPYITSPLRVSSAFGGLAIYRMKWALQSEYVGWQDDGPICEHVPFNEQLTSAGARLFIHPNLINMVPERILSLAKAVGYI